MALYATHLRFARDLAPFLKIKNFSDYYSGVTYPDSRNATGVLREKTHEQDNPFLSELDDFSKGWAVHNLYDDLSEDFYVKNSPWPNEELLAPNRAWLFATAEKVIEDWFSFDILGDDYEQIFKQLACPEVPPNNEDYLKLQNFYVLITKAYSQRPTTEDFKKIFLICRSSVETAEKILTFVEQIKNDRLLVLKINDIYNQVKQLTEEKFLIKFLKN